MKSLEEVLPALTGPGCPFEIELKTIGKRANLRCWKTGPQTAKDVWNATKSHPQDSEYLVYYGDGNRSSVRISYAEARSVVDKLAFQMRHRFGLKKGDRVGIAMRNYIQFPLIFFAALSIGLIVVPYNAWLLSHELQFCINDSGCSLLFVDPEREERLESVKDDLKKKGLKNVVFCRSGTDEDKGKKRKWSDAEWDEVVAGGRAEMPVGKIDPEDDATIFYTSGTTGNPKGALSSHRSIVTVVNNMLFSNFANALRASLPPPSLTANLGRVYLVPTPMFHITAMLSVCVPLTNGGGKAIFLHKWDPTLALEIIQKEKVNQMTGVPTQVWQLLEHPRIKEYDLKSMSVLGSGGAPAAAALPKTIVRVIPSASTANGYGMTETNAAFIRNTAAEYAQYPASVGRPFPTHDVRLVDESGNDVKRGELGEILVRGPLVCKGYWGNPGKTKEAFTDDGWYRTGDVAREDLNGLFYIMDRIKDLIIRGGENVYSVDVENRIYDLPGVIEAAVLGIPHRVLGENVVAVVRVNSELFGRIKQEDIQEHCRKTLAGFKVPVFIDIRSEPLPTNANGKILKRELRDETYRRAKASGYDDGGAGAKL